MATDQDATPSSDERLMATLAHSLGLLVALIIWATQKDKSRFVRFQAMQAVAYDLAAGVLFVALVGCMVAAIVGGTVLSTAALSAAASNNDGGVEAASLLLAVIYTLPFASACIILLVALAVFAGRVVAAFNVYQGRNYHHPFIGSRLEKMMG